MPTPTKGPRLGGSPAHQKLIVSNLATALFEHGRIVTTHAKAKRLRPIAERLITLAKRGDLHARRQVMSIVRDKSVVHELFTQIGPRFVNRPGGYTRITKLVPRKGDNAPMASIELVEALTIAQQAVGEAERARGTKFAENAQKTEQAAPAVEKTDAAGVTGEEVDASASEKSVTETVEVEATDGEEVSGEAKTVEAEVARDDQPAKDSAKKAASKADAE